MGILAYFGRPHCIFALFAFICRLELAHFQRDFFESHVPSFKESTKQYRFLVQVFRRFSEREDWLNIGTATLITESKAFTAAYALYRDQQTIIGYSNIGCYGTEGEDEYIPKFTAKERGPTFHATRLLVAGGRAGLGMITFEEKLGLVKKPIPHQKTGMSEFEVCYSFSWPIIGKTGELTRSRFVILPWEQCLTKFNKLPYHLCGRSDSNPKRYLGDGDLGAALICQGKLSGVGIPVKNGSGYETRIATFVSVALLQGKFNLEDDKGHMLELDVNWEFACLVAIFWKYFIGV